MIKGTFLNSKIARRIFGLFLLTALLPILTLAFFSFKQIDDISAQSIQQTLRQEAKNHGLLIHGTLEILEKKLQLYRHLSAGSTLNGQNWSSELKHITVVDIEAMDSGLDNIDLTEAEITHLKSFETLLHVKQTPNSSPVFLLLYPDVLEQKIIIGEIRNDALWGEPETFSASKDFCIFGHNANAPFFCSDDSFHHTLKQNQTNKAEKQFISSWSLFTKPRYFYPQFDIVIGVDKVDSLASTSTLKNTFSTISLLTLFIVTLVSISQIRRSLTPLEALMSGIKRIANNNFGQTVNIEADNEFKQLGNSFNAMSTQISHQFDFLSTLSEIDQIMLQNMNEQEIIANTIELINKAVQSKGTSIALFDEQQPNTLTIYSQDTNDVHGLSHQFVKITAAEIEACQCNEAITYHANDPQLPYYLKTILLPDTVTAVIVPVLINDSLKALLIFNFETSAIDKEKFYRLHELAARLSIALEKSAWDEKLYQQAHYDMLTGLPNRLLLDDRLQQAINNAQQNDSVFSILFLDLDQFKIINDSFGHSAGDKLLKAVAKSLKQLLHDDVTISRLGGDEFIILVPNQPDEKRLYTTVSNMVNTLLLTLSKPIFIEQQEIHISTSIGIANFPSDGTDVTSLMDNADSAMYHAKELGRNNAQFYSAELTEKALQELVLKTDLHNALKNNEFIIFYQPKVCAKTHSIVGAEALIRWQHPQKGLIPPFLFIPAAEESGLITDIGEWVINKSCQQNKLWQDAGLPPIKISVNLSPKQFEHQALIAVIQEALFNSKLEGKYLDLEIVEDTAMNDINQTIAILEQLKQLDLSISIDDYGIGFSNLSYIKQFPVDTLKIDKSFIDNITSDKGDQAIVNSTITLAHDLGLTVVAEGVEDHQQLAKLTHFECDEIQGYYFSKPIPAEEFEQLLLSSPLKTELNSNKKVRMLKP